MVTERRFCSSCGKPVVPQDQFCGSCGSPLGAPAAPLQTAPAAAEASFSTPVPQVSPQPAAPDLTASEIVTGVFLASRKTGMFSQEAMHIILTGRRMVFAAFTNDMVKQAAKEEGKAGFMAGMMGAMTVGYTYYKHYLSMSAEAALKENPQNFAIERSNIRRVKLELGKRQVDKNRHVDTHEPSKLEIETTGAKYSFSVPNHFHEMAASVLRQAGLI